MQIVAPVLGAVDETMRRVNVTRAINEAMGTHIGPWEWDSWPVEFIDIIIASVTRDSDGE